MLFLSNRPCLNLGLCLITFCCLLRPLGAGDGVPTGSQKLESLGLVTPDFETAMGDRSITWGWWSSNDRFWVSLFDQLYEQNLRMIVAPGETGAKQPMQTRIPKLVHHVWLGGNSMPPQFQAWRESWMAKHPDWKFMLWTEAEAKEIDMLNPDAYHNAPNLGSKSDALRLEVVWRFGGLYIDVDFECLGRFDELHERLDFYAALSNVGAIEVSNGIFAARKRHPLVEKIIMTPAENLPPPGSASQLNWIGMPTIINSGPGRFTRVLMEELGQQQSDDFGAVVILPINFVFPLPNSIVSADGDARERLREKVIHPETIALHHWAGSWLKQQVGLPVWSQPKHEGKPGASHPSEL